MSHPNIAAMGGAVLVTGANGLIGSSVCEALIQRGVNVVGTDRRPASYESHHVLACDLTDKNEVLRLSAEADIAAVVHCGALSGPMVSRDDPLAIIRANIDGTAHVLELARQRAAKKFIYCSSTSVYGRIESQLPVTEESVLRPTSVYGASKAAGELLTSAFSRQYGSPAISLRISTVYGPRRRNFCAIRAMVDAAEKHESLILEYGRDYQRQYIHVNDATQAVLCALEAPAVGPHVYNITGGSCATLEQVAAHVRTILPDLEVFIGEDPDPLEDIQSEFSISAAQQAIGYRPLVSLIDGIRSLASERGQAE